MVEQPAPASNPAATERQLAGFIDRFTPEIASRARTCRAALRRRVPTAVELVYDNYNALAIGYAPGERLSEVVFSLAIYPRGVSLYFMHGARLADPDGLLQGDGNKGRFVRLVGPETLAEPGVEALIATALEDAPHPLPPEGEGRTVIKSISAKQRPRRPTAQEPA